MFVIRFSKLINRSLIRIFDQSRLKYMAFVFPAYQLLAFIGVVAIVGSFQSAERAFFFGPLALLLAFFVGVPIMASWHLSCLLFSQGYFGFLAGLGIPCMPWAAMQLENAVNWFRPAQ